MMNNGNHMLTVTCITVRLSQFTQCSPYVFSTKKQILLVILGCWNMQFPSVHNLTFT